MKLLTNNFSGYTPSGNRYKITMKTAPCAVEKYTAIHVCLFEEIEGIKNSFWSLQDNVCNVYVNQEEYNEALKVALIDAEKKFGIQLLKSPLKVAS
ncbi:hypothetical protein [uncultured Winogradskyella sp.]|uniref:hypothetical protein n=1 Tax=uncultured Winogradskyella sp. TaxID=395353 RepID=UPI0026378EB1|nr:hypothetical protein [uncultured Winogradskyella sp.]